MDHDDPSTGPERPSRRRFIELATGALGAVGYAACRGSEDPPSEGPARPPPDPAAGRRSLSDPSDQRYNVLLLVTDQERWFDEWPVPLPGRQRLAERGVRFDNHQIASNVCSPSRSVIYTGRHIQHTGVYDNVNTPWQDSMSPKIPTIGTMMREAGYYTAYKGKFHLAVELEEENEPTKPTRLLTEVLAAYGFADYFGVGDIIGTAHGGYLHDEIITSTAVRWLRAKGRPLSDEGKPWFLAVNLVNPHDVMYVDTDAPGQRVQGAHEPVMEIRPPPDTPLYRATWDLPLPATRHQAFDAPGRPPAHRAFQDARAVLLGTWPDVDERWRRLRDYYLNCIRDSDRHVARLLAELDDQGLFERTIVVMTSDHGELGGAHQMHGKGPCAYREQNHVPLIIAHPEVPGGQRCRALTSHVDLAPTLLAFAGAAPSDLVGHSLLPLLREPAAAAVHALRQGTLFNFNMLSYLDSDFLRQLKQLRDARRLGKVARGAGVAGQVGPALHNRGAIRSVFDGRYRFSRYFSPRQHHRPETLEALTSHNDLELFDLETDPDEAVNLATDPAQESTLVSMNAVLNQLLDAEVGRDDGATLPLARFKDWDLETADI